ncbi:MAG: aminopeptidase P family protein [Candidatus Kapaibacterium sp.]|nr:MAG: aminopeptidase P family protein [Candidatus Kapabacteria bacterium]
MPIYLFLTHVSRYFFAFLSGCCLLIFVVATSNHAFSQPLEARYWLAGRNADDAPLSRYQERRERISAALSEKSFCVMFAADERNRQNDVNYEYRQNSDVFYTTGFSEARSAFILAPRGIILPDSLDSTRTKHTALLFVQAADAQQQLWTGALTGVRRARELYGIMAVENKHLRGILAGLAATHDTTFITELPTTLVVKPFLDDSLDIQEILVQDLKKQYPSLTVRSHQRLLGELRKIKDSHEVELLKKAVQITIAAHREAILATQPEMFEYEIEATMEAGFKRRGAEDVGYASIIGAGANSCVLHYTASRRQMRSGEILLMDCGAEYHNYTADITRTIPVSGTFSAEQAALYDIVYAAQEAAIKEYRAGVDWRKPHSRAVEVIRAGLLKLGIITQPDDYKLYFPHGSVHYIGLDVHDAGSYGQFQPNMVLTCEPGIYIPENSPCDKKWWNIGIRIEDDILITTGDPVLLSAALPRKREELEKLMKSRTKRSP